MYDDDGPPDRVVFALHGTPGSRVPYPPFVDDARRRGLRLITYDRPGYGGSTAAPGRTVGATATEVSAIADALGVERFGVWGFSGGGAPALACAALLAKRVVGAGVVAGVAPYPADGLDWLAGTGEWNVADFRLMLDDRAAWLQKTRRDRDEMLGWDAPKLREGLATLCSEVDRAALTEPVVDFILRQAREGLRPGDAGVRDDTLSLILPWGFAPEAVRAPVQLWHGGQDRFVPFSHGRWLAERVPGVEAHLLPEEGHLSLWLRHVPEVQRWLASRF